MAKPGDPSEVFYMRPDGYFLTFTLSGHARETLSDLVGLRRGSPEAASLCAEVERMVCSVPRYQRQDLPRLASRVAALQVIEAHVWAFVRGFWVAEWASVLDPDTLDRLKAEAAALKSRYDGRPHPVPDLDLSALDGALRRFQREIGGTLKVLGSAAQRAREKLEAESRPGRSPEQWERRFARELAAVHRRYVKRASAMKRAEFVLTVFGEVFETDDAREDEGLPTLDTVRGWLGGRKTATE